MTYLEAIRREEETMNVQGSTEDTWLETSSECADTDAEEENTHFKRCEILNFSKRENKNLYLEKSVMTYRLIEKISIAI